MGSRPAHSLKPCRSGPRHGPGGHAIRDTHAAGVSGMGRAAAKAGCGASPPPEAMPQGPPAGAGTRQGGVAGPRSPPEIMPKGPAAWVRRYRRRGYPCRRGLWHGSDPHRGGLRGLWSLESMPERSSAWVGSPLRCLDPCRRGLRHGWPHGPAACDPRGKPHRRCPRRSAAPAASVAGPPSEKRHPAGPGRGVPETWTSTRETGRDPDRRPSRSRPSPTRRGPPAGR